MQFTPADSTIAFELEEQRIMKDSERENSRSPAIGDDSLLDGSMMDATCLNDTAILDQVRAIYKLFLSLFVDICAGC